MQALREVIGEFYDMTVSSVASCSGTDFMRSVLLDADTYDQCGDSFIT